MAWTRVPQVSVGELWTAAMHNTYIRDNFAAEPPYIFDGAKQIPVGVENNIIGKVGATSSMVHQELTIVPQSGNTPRHLGYAHRSGIKYVNYWDRNVPPGVPYNLLIFTLVVVNAPFVNYSDGLVHIPIDGWYIINVGTYYIGGTVAGASTLSVGFGVELNGVINYYWSDYSQVAEGPHKTYITRLLYLNSGSLITPYARHYNQYTRVVNYCVFAVARVI